MSQTTKQVADGIDMNAYEEREGRLLRRKERFERVEAMPKTVAVKLEPSHDYKAEFLQQIALAGLPLPSHGDKKYGCQFPEYQFHETRKWRIDFAYVVLNLAIEFQGINWKPKNGDDAKSGHQSISGLIRDCEKFSELSLAGWRLILINAKTVESGLALAWVERVLKGRV